MKFCAKCGASLGDGKAFCPKCGHRAEPTSGAKKMAKGRDSTRTIYAKDMPVLKPPGPEPPPNFFHTSTPGPADDRFSFTTPPPPPSPPSPPPKKGRKGRIVLIVLGLLLLAVLGIGGGMLYMFNAAHTYAVEATDAYWDGQINADAQALAEDLPEDYWTYMEKAYGYDADTCIEAYESYLQSQYSPYGGELEYHWESTESFQYQIWGGVGSRDVARQLDRYDLSWNQACSIPMKVELMGNLLETQEESWEMWFVRVDGTWCNAKVMEEIEAACQVQQQQQQCIAEIEAALPTMLTNYRFANFGSLIPSAFWLYVENEYGYNHTTGEYILQSHYNSCGSIDTYADIQIMDITLWSEENAVEVYPALVEALGPTEFYAVNYQNSDGEGYYLDVVQIDGQWYCLDFLDSYESIIARY